MSAAQTRWITTAREGLTAAVRPTAASRHPVLAVPAAARMSPVVKQFSPLSVRVHIQLILTFWVRMLTFWVRREPVQSFLCQFSKPICFSLSKWGGPPVYSFFCHHLDLGHHMDAIFKFANNILNNLWNTGINPLFSLNCKSYQLFPFFWDHSLMTFISSNGSSCGRCYVTPIFCSE